MALYTKHPREESNPDQEGRNLLFSPLNYEDRTSHTGLEPATNRRS